MVKEKNAPVLVPKPKERKQTDNRLAEERQKTDKALYESREVATDLADVAVSEIRTKGDLAKAQARCEVDSKTDEIVNPFEAAVAEKLLLEERNAANDALHSQRQHMDSIVERERNEMQTTERNKKFKGIFFSRSF